MGFCNCSMFFCALLYVHSSFAIILMGKRELVALLSFSSWCLVIDVWLFLAVPWVSLQFVIVVFPDHTRLLFMAVYQDAQFDLFLNQPHQSHTDIRNKMCIIVFPFFNIDIFTLWYTPEN